MHVYTSVYTYKKKGDYSPFTSPLINGHSP